MSSKKVYLLYLLMLGGCSNITHRHSIYEATQSSNSYASMLIDEPSKQNILAHILKYTCNNNIDALRDWITERLL
ncbi:MAG: hypothetical protein NMK33_00490 [Candidatus Cardinium sp.]|uniref:hypothetical protein n=1 Tax=Cardinium endosymbiont of Dermatophagoides farinae TaxID=2597823 RepID=UPI001182A6E9|nr:hypothetical protein [Cardinium endosymbiont of Dermatophagoides farinae]TSJ81008.1 hypothetical protein FPG78_03170 [Cardinium endosymbiont of Dermatophagoides farinae]UWW97034.1 MAG: hypothetical protein NMK33_00490 [Candidatus Cardinium sp.]